MKNIIKEFLVTTIGATLFAAGFSLFLQPHSIAPGGLVGVSVIVHYLTEIPSGAFIFAMNIPLWILAYTKIGKRFTLTTMYSVTISSFLIDFFALINLETEPLLASIYGGILLGLGLGMIFAIGGSTGGTDIITRLIQLYNPHLSIGQVMIFVDLSIVLSGVIIFRSINKGLYAIIALSIMSKVIDMVIEGPDNAKMVYIISDKNEEIAQKIIEEVQRGATILDGHGAYTKAHKNVIICALKVKQIPVMKEVVIKIDPTAFMIVTDVREVLGDGFKLGKIK